MMDPKRQRTVGITSLVLVALFSLACATPSPAPPPRAGTYSEYRVGAPDELFIVIFPDPIIQRSARVRPDGMISLDLIGDVPAAGRTIDEISADIEKRISRFKRDPSVTVQLEDTLSTGISIVGEVRKPSSFPLVKDTRVHEAIAQVGGETTFARSKKIRVIRSGGGETAVYLVDLDAIRAGDLSTNIQLASGDIIYAEPNIFAKIGYVVQAVLFPFQPLLGLGMSIAGSFIGGG
jgi:polysaccharide export outer membrane protein